MEKLLEIQKKCMALAERKIIEIAELRLTLVKITFS